jgi:integrase
MAYAEKRGKGPAPWRVKYRLPSGIETSESGFETKAAALTWGRDQEARIREGRWTDPNAGKLTVGEWIDRWLAIQDVGISTVDHRGYLLRRFIRPAWDETPLHSLSTEEITRWENALPARTGVSPRTARAARTLLGTILGDAATTRPPLIPYNPALRPRNRGRRTGRRLQLSPQRAWATPLETVLLAERAALMTGRDEDFTMIVTIGYTGLRWGEAIGLERDHLHPGAIHVEWQLRELNGRFHRLPPKDDSYRSPAWDPCLPVDLPPFLIDLLSRQTQDHPHLQCGCVAQHGGSCRYVFLGPDGGHYRRSNYARRVFRPACDGRHEAKDGRPPKLVIADATTWPGIPIAAWPPADLSVGYAPPRGRGIQAIRDDTPLACWLPIKPGLTVHGLRHGHKTWMAEDGIPEILAEQRLGHQVPGIRGLYAHASDRMRDDLKQALQTRWEDSLRARAAISPRSPVPLLDQLLTAEGTHQNHATPGDREKMISQIPPNRPRRPSRATLAIRGEPELTASDLARYLKSGSGAKGTRTPDPLLAKQVLFQLSYSPAPRRFKGTRSALAQRAPQQSPRQVGGAGEAVIGEDPGDLRPGSAPFAAEPSPPSAAAPVRPATGSVTRPAAWSMTASPASTPGSSAKLPSRWVAPARCSRSRVCPPVRIPATIWAPARRPHRTPLSVPPA